MKTGTCCWRQNEEDMLNLESQEMKDEEIKKLTVRDVVTMPEFKEEMERQVTIEEDSHTANIAGMRLKRTPLDSLRERGSFKADTLVQLFTAILNKSLLGYSANERDYIYRMGLVCFGRVLVRLR